MKNPLCLFAVPDSLQARFEAREAEIRQATLEALAAAISECSFSLQGLLSPRTGAATDQTLAN